MIIVAGSLIVRENKILMVQEAKKECYGQWNFPAGHVDEIRIEDVGEKDMVKLFIEANKIASSLTMNLEKEKLLKILSNLVAISKLLNYSDDELNDYCIEKMNKTLNMIS